MPNGAAPREPALRGVFMGLVQKGSSQCTDEKNMSQRVKYAKRCDHSFFRRGDRSQYQGMSHLSAVACGFR